MIIKRKDENIDSVFELSNFLTNRGLINYPQDQIVEITETELQLKDVFLDDTLADIMKEFPRFNEFEIVNEPEEKVQFQSLQNLPDRERISTVPVFDNLYGEKSSEKLNRETFSEHNINNNENNLESMNQNQNLEQEMEIKPFTDQEIEEAAKVYNPTKGDPSATPPSKPGLEVEGEATPETIAAFNAHARIRVYSKYGKILGRKFFNEDISDKERKQLVEDILLIAEEVPEIKDEIVTKLVPETTPEEIEDEIANAETFSDEEIIAAGGDDLEDDDEVEEITTFSDEEIAEAERKEREAAGEDKPDKTTEKEEITKCPEYQKVVETLKEDDIQSFAELEEALGEIPEEEVEVLTDEQLENLPSEVGLVEEEADQEEVKAFKAKIANRTKGVRTFSNEGLIISKRGMRRSFAAKTSSVAEIRKQELERLKNKRIIN